MRFHWLETAGTRLFLVYNDTESLNGMGPINRAFIVKYVRQFDILRWLIRCHLRPRRALDTLVTTGRSSAVCLGGPSALCRSDNVTNAMSARAIRVGCRSGSNRRKGPR